MNTIKCFQQKLICSDLVLIDGVSRAGKLLLGGLVSSFNRVEHIEFGEQLEYIIPFVTLKKVKIDFARSYLANYFNQITYNKFISRNVNFRPKDVSGIMRSRDPKIYQKRLKLDDGDSVLERIKKAKPIIPFVTHELALNLGIIKKLNLKLRMIEILRSPIEIVFSWYKRGLGRRFGNDQRLFTLLIEKKKLIYPWFSALINTKSLKLNEFEYCASMVVQLLNISIPNIKKYKKSLYLTSYDLITQNTLSELKKIAFFLKTRTNNKTLQFIKRENCPVVYDYKVYYDKYKFLKENCSNQIFQKLINLENSYKKNYYNLF